MAALASSLTCACCESSSNRRACPHKKLSSPGRMLL